MAMTTYQPLLVAIGHYSHLKLRWKWLLAELVLESLMLIAPVNLDFLGAVSEYLVDEGRGKVELAIGQRLATA